MKLIHRRGNKSQGNILWTKASRRNKLFSLRESHHNSDAKAEKDHKSRPSIADRSNKKSKRENYITCGVWVEGESLEIDREFSARLTMERKIPFLSFIRIVYTHRRC
jgi:hypothetical protein